MATNSFSEDGEQLHLIDIVWSKSLSRHRHCLASHLAKKITHLFTLLLASEVRAELKVAGERVSIGVGDRFPEEGKKNMAYGQ